MDCLARNIKTAPSMFDSRFNDNERKILTFEQRSSAIERFLRSEYTKNLIDTLGLKSVYNEYKDVIHDYCDITEFIKHAKRLIKDDKVKDPKDFGDEFLFDSEKWRKGWEDFSRIQKHIFKSSNDKKN